MTAATDAVAGLPDMKVSVRQVFGIDSDMEVPAFSEPDEHVPEIDADYRFDRPTTLAILAGFAKNRRVMVTGYHGTGKSTHIEQVAARLNWPCIRVNLDSHISRIDLIGKDAIVIHEGQLTYADHRLHPVLDLGVWWRAETGLPLPLGGNAIRRDLPPDGRSARMSRRGMRSPACSMPGCRRHDGDPRPR